MATQRNGEEPVVLTRSGYEKLKQELVGLRTEGRAEIAAKLAEARAFGDLSENAEYHAAKEEQEKLESRILWLESQLSRAKVVDVTDLDVGHVSLGTTVVRRRPSPTPWWARRRRILRRIGSPRSARWASPSWGGPSARRFP
jgi:transcription elongation factor GreA